MRAPKIKNKRTQKHINRKFTENIFKCLTNIFLKFLTSLGMRKIQFLKVRHYFLAIGWAKIFKFYNTKFLQGIENSTLIYY